MLKAILFISFTLYLNIYGAPLPPMGWSSFCIKEKSSLFEISCDPTAANAEVIFNSSKILQSSFKNAGYEYIIIENSWPDASRDSNGELVGSKSFLSGFKNMSELISSIKSLGFKVGISTSATEKSCYGEGAGSYNNYPKDIKTFLKWGVDYIKLEWCDGATLPAGSSDIPSLFKEFGQNLRGSNPSIFFAASEFNDDEPWNWGSGFADSWRVGPTHIPRFWSSLGLYQDTYALIGNLVGKSQFAGTSKGWNDPQFILNQNEEYQFQTQVAIWAITNSPMIFSTDMTNIPSFYQKILLNKDLIAINQDITSVGDLISSDSGQVWAKKLKDGSIVIVLYNDSLIPFNSKIVAAQFSDLGLSKNATVDSRDILTGDVHHGVKNAFSQKLDPEETSIIILTPHEAK